MSCFQKHVNSHFASKCYLQPAVPLYPLMIVTFEEFKVCNWLILVVFLHIIFI